MPNRKTEFVLPEKATCKCQFECKVLSSCDIRKLHDELHSLPYTSQNTYLMSRINLIPIRRRCHGTYTDSSQSKRQTSVTYTIPSDKGSIQVCNNTFRAVFNLSKNRNQGLLDRIKKGDIVFNDGRGKNINSRRIKYTDNDRNLVKNHILSFPREESHYSRHKSSKEYLSPDLNIHRMYKAFKEVYPQTNIREKYYRRVFKKDFKKLSFKRPRTDTCRVCDKFQAQIKSTNGVAKLQIISKLELHHRKANKATSLLSTSIIKSQYPSSVVTSVAIDMQQVLFTPTLTHSNMFYSRQLSNYNLCIHVGTHSKNFMCMWHEGVAGRGGNEVGSCLLKVLTSQLTPKKHLEIWCDNCAGQNKNRMVLLVIVFLVLNGYYDKIDLKFLVSGHSYMPCDRDFGVIEKRKRVSRCMVPEEIQEMVRSARLENPFEVVLMEKGDFFDVGIACDLYLNTTALKISEQSWIRVSTSTLPYIKTKKSFSDLEEWDVKPIFKKQKYQSFKTLGNFPPGKKVPVMNEGKKKDLLAMLEFLEEKYHAFYKDVCK